MKVHTKFRRHAYKIQNVIFVNKFLISNGSLLKFINFAPYNT